MPIRWAVFFLCSGALWAQPAFDASVQTLVVEGASPVIYAGWPLPGGAASALFRSADEGVSWLPVYLNEPGLPQPFIRSLVVDPTNSAILFIATDSAHGGIWRSADSGASWSAANTGLPADDRDVQSLFLLRSNPQQMYARTAHSVHKSTNGGRSWTHQGALPDATSMFTINAGNPSHMYAATSAGAIYHSADEGVGWQWMSALPLRYGNSADSITDLVSAPLNFMLVFAAVRGPLMWMDNGSGAQQIAGLQSSPDFGVSWTNIAPATEPYFFYPDPTGRSMGYYTYPESHNVCKTVNFQSQVWNCVSVGGSGPIRLWIQPSAPDTMYGGASDGIYKSTDGAATWRHLQGTVRPSLAKPVDPLNFTLIAGTRGYRKLDVQALEKSEWSMPFTASTNDSWLSLSAASGTAPAALQVNVNTSGLVEGSYQGTIQLASPFAANSPISVPVRLIVTAAAALGPAYDLNPFVGAGKHGFAGDGGSASAALLADAAGLALDGAGNLYIADSSNHRVRKVSSDGVIHTIAGTGEFGFSGDNGPAVAAQLWRPEGVGAFGTNVYIADSFNSRLRMINGAGVISTVLSDETSVPVWHPRGIAADASGNVFIADSTKKKVVKLAANGAAKTVAQNLNAPADVTLNASGMLYVADTGSHRILKIDLDGNVTLVAGTGRQGFDGDGGPATAASLSAPEGVAVDQAGQVYIGDTGNHRVRVISPQGIIRTVAGTGTAGSGGTGGPAAGAQLSQPSDLVVDASGALYVADKGNDRVVKLTLQAGSGPRISAGGVLNAASYTAETAPGALFSIFGAELATGAEQATAMPWPLTLAGASVTVNGRAAPLYYAGPNQINAQVPYETPLGPVQVIVSMGQTYSAPAPLTVNVAAPGIFQSSLGRALAQNADYSLNGPENPAVAGSVITVYLTGQGLLDHAIATGAAAPLETLSKPVLPVAATMGGQAAEVLFLGMTPGLVGLAQANVRIPALPEGDHPLVVTVGTSASEPALITVRP